MMGAAHTPGAENIAGTGNAAGAAYDTGVRSTQGTFASSGGFGDDRGTACSLRGSSADFPTSDSVYLQRMKLDAFGAFSNKVVGPFVPGMNLVFGKNEAGKTTLNAFFGGVLFGWEEARGARNTYRPKNAERSGSLFFSDRTGEREYELSRNRNVDGLVGACNLVDDIDKETFSTMFGLTSDELRSLRNTSDVTAKLLTAGSGTGASPAATLTELQTRLNGFTSRAAGAEHSLVHLEARQLELKAALTDAANEAQRFKHEDREYHELEPQRNALTEKLHRLNAGIEELTAQRASLEKLDVQLERILGQRAALLEEERSLVQERRAHEQDVDKKTARISLAEDYAIRDRIDVLQEERSKTEHSVQLAKEAYTASKAHYETLLEDESTHELQARAKRQKRIQIALSTVLPMLFVIVGIPVFVHGRDINSLSFTVLGIALVFFAVLLGGAAVAMLFRPNKSQEALAQKVQDSNWVMRQDKKKLEACEADLLEQEAKTEGYLNGQGLEAAHGSLRRARILLDEAKDARAQSNLFAQKQQALHAQLSELDEAVVDVHRQREKAFERLGLPPNRTLADIDAIIAQKTQQRAGLIEASENINRRFGELKQELSQAKQMKRFDALKLEYQQIRTRQKESSEDYARLLLAKRMLEAAIAAWESKSQPEVYKQASRLLSDMTAGMWTQVRMTPEGKLQVIDQVKTAREPMYLSLGTCQQLYLSLRIALLLTAENVGRAVPILADDILVNFDSERRLGAARALLELSQKRQVVLFTCHEEIVRLVQTLDPQINLVEL